MTDKPTITQADRDAMADTMLDMDMLSELSVNHIRSGGYDYDCRFIAAHRESSVAELQAEVERLREALRAIMDMPGEINPSNYDDHDVDALNNAHIETYNICKAALDQKEPVE